MRCRSTDCYRVKSGRPMLYRCRDCRKYFSLKTNTAMEASNLPLRKWRTGAGPWTPLAWRKPNGGPNYSPGTRGATLRPRKRLLYWIGGPTWGSTPSVSACNSCTLPRTGQVGHRLHTHEPHGSAQRKLL